LLAVHFTAAQWIVLIGTTCTGIATVITAYAAIVRAKKEVRTEAEIECLERLKKSRLESEELADELHQQRMRREA
jgi:hypothetical protein